MNKDDFFKQVDQHIAKDRQNTVQKHKQTKTASDLARRIVADAMPVLTAYKEELSKRGFAADLRSDETSFSFTLRYVQGGDIGFRFGLISASQVPAFTKHGTDNGKGYALTLDPGMPIDDNWNVTAIEEILQKTVNEFLAESPRRGGVKPQGEIGI